MNFYAHTKGLHKKKLGPLFTQWRDRPGHKPLPKNTTTPISDNKERGVSTLRLPNPGIPYLRPQTIHHPPFHDGFRNVTHTQNLITLTKLFATLTNQIHPQKMKKIIRLLFSNSRYQLRC